MSSHPATDHRPPEPSDNKALFSALGWLGALGIFVLIVFLAYLPNMAPDPEEVNAPIRQEIRAETEATQNRLATSYSWENQANEVVRIPLDAAMALTLEELRAENASKLPEGGE